MRNPNNIAVVAFPNGAVRRRNCSTTVKPDEMIKVDNPYPANADLYSKFNYTKAHMNKLIRDNDYHTLSYKRFARRALVRSLLIIASALLCTAIIITETILNS